MEPVAQPALRDPAPETDLREWYAILDRLKVDRVLAHRIADRATRHGTSFLREVVASRRVSEHDLYREIARELGVGFLTRLDPGSLLTRERERLMLLARGHDLRGVQIVRPDSETAMVVAPDSPNIAATRAILKRQPDLAGRIYVAPPSVIRKAILSRSERALSTIARSMLFDRWPDYSARFVATAWQGMLIGIVLVALPLVLVVHNAVATLVIHAFMSLAFMSCVALRMCALTSARRRSPKPLDAIDPAELPVYSVLVALHREAEVVSQLLVALGRLEWPRSKLEIKLVCEADDAATLQALSAHRLHPCVEVLEVPPATLRTKPKALAYALPLCSGEFVALFDAEDQPHPRQVLEAWQKFRDSNEDLACVQAPLNVTNASDGMIARMFAFEYSGLFHGILPWLAGAGLMFPLGGTSNHFRRSALEEAGGWDPYNVTEDADLGIRLVRLGFRTEMISRPTFEDAPETLAAWLPQRTRWFKGWMQTWLVHMRRPRALLRELGPGSFIVSQILFLGLLMSALIHPVFLGTALYHGIRLLMGAEPGTHGMTLFLIDAANISCGYIAFWCLGAWTQPRSEKPHLWKLILFTPVYWTLQSVAAWNAILEIHRKPHHWNKTPHRTSRAVLPL